MRPQTLTENLEGAIPASIYGKTACLVKRQFDRPRESSQANQQPNQNDKHNPNKDLETATQL